MEIKVIHGDITTMKDSAILLSYFEGGPLESDMAAADKALGGAISQLIERGEIKGKPNEITIIYTLGKLPSACLAVIGLGKKSEINSNKIRGAVAVACRLIRQKNNDVSASVALRLGIDAISAENEAQAICEGILLGTYQFRKHISKPQEYQEIKYFNIVEPDKGRIPAMERGCHKGKVIAEAANFARDMVNEPANFKTPTVLAEAAKNLASTYNIGVAVLEKDEMQKLGMGGLLGVAQGSQQPPKFIVLSYKGRNSEELDLALCGKGITFDSGGISIKPSEKMDEMKGDMAGGAAVMATLSVIAQLKPGINVAAIVPATENLPSGSALKPGDILTAMNGKTIEIISTDAEGRLIIADALSYANIKLKAKALIDVATLTGACRVALGDICTGAFGNNQELMNKVIAAGNEAGECVWQMPMNEEYKEQNQSDVADIKNTGGRGAGAITAALFLGEFAGNTPWVHLDIAGTSMAEKERGYLVKGATGVPVRTLVNLVMAMAE